MRTMTQHPLARGTGGAARFFLVAPGPRLATIGRVLAGLSGAVTDLDDIADLCGRSTAEDVELVLDADALALEDLGYVRRFLTQSGAPRATIFGDDPGTRVARTLLGLPRTRWMSWPPVLDDLVALSGFDAAAPTSSGSRSPERSSSEQSAAMAARRTTSAPRAIASDPLPESDSAESDSEADEIDRIQAILEGTLAVEEREERPARRASEREAGQIDTAPRERKVELERADDEEMADDPALDFDPEIPPHTPEAAAVQPASDAPPPWWRAQVADLADAAQRVELGVQALRLSEPDDPEEVREHVDLLDAEVARLVQFARTLGYVASPPARGDQVFDLADTVQMFVAQLASRPERSPRCQFRSTEPVYVRSDRALLGQAFDAFFWLAGACAGTGDLVRAQVIRDGGPAEVRLEFPSGPLTSVETARILEPYGLRRILPDLGPNALSAASSIIVGQGGRAELTRFASGRLGWRITLPAVDAPAKKSK